MHDTQKTTLQYVADVCLPIALYYVVSNIALYVINFIVQYVAERFFADGTAWVIRNAAALQVADNAAAMCLGFFCVRRAFLSETAAGGEPVLVAPRRVASGWLLEGVQRRKKDWFWYIPLLLSGTGAALAPDTFERSSSISSSICVKRIFSSYSFGGMLAFHFLQCWLHRRVFETPTVFL